MATIEVGIRIDKRTGMAFSGLEAVRAYAANRVHADVSRELGGQDLALGRGAQAVGERACSLYPANAGLRSNLALACLIAGDTERAKADVGRAIEMDPADKISRARQDDRRRDRGQAAAADPAPVTHCC